MGTLTRRERHRQCSSGRQASVRLPNTAFGKSYPIRGTHKVARWWSALAERESVRGSAVHDLRERFNKMVGRDRGGYRSVVGARIAG